MKKSFFQSLSLNPNSGRKRLMDQSGTQLEKPPSGLLTMISRRAYRV